MPMKVLILTCVTLGERNGGPRRTRTFDFFLVGETLYQLSYGTENWTLFQRAPTYLSKACPVHCYQVDRQN